MNHSPEGMLPEEVEEEAAKFEREQHKGSDLTNADTTAPGTIESGIKEDEQQSVVEVKNETEPISNGQNWLDRQKNNFSEFVKSYFSAEDSSGDFGGKVMNVLTKINGPFVAAAGAYFIHSADKLTPVLGVTAPVEFLGASMIGIGLATAGAATYETWRERHRSDEIRRK